MATNAGIFLYNGLSVSCYGLVMVYVLLHTDWQLQLLVCGGAGGAHSAMHASAVSPFIDWQLAVTYDRLLFHTHRPGVACCIGIFLRHQ
jgi:hypothetical protein